MAAEAAARLLSCSSRRVVGWGSGRRERELRAHGRAEVPASAWAWSPHTASEDCGAWCGVAAARRVHEQRAFAAVAAQKFWRHCTAATMGWREWTCGRAASIV